MVKDDPLAGIAPGVKITAQMSPEVTFNLSDKWD